DVEGEDVWRLVGVDATVGRKAVVFHLEGEGGVRVRVAVVVGVGRVNQVVRQVDFLACRDGSAADGQRALGGQRRDDDRLEGVGGRIVVIVRIEHAASQRGEVGAVGGEVEGGVLVDGLAVVGADGLTVDRGDVDGHRGRSGRVIGAGARVGDGEREG